MDGNVIIGTELDTKSFDAQIKELEDKLDTLEQEYEAALKDAEFPEDELKKYQSEIEKTKNRIIDLRKRQDDLNKTELSKISATIGNIGAGVERVTKKIVGWGLAIFGIRGAFSAIRNAMSSIATEDNQIATDIEYIRWILAQTIKPVVEWLIKGLYLILSLINMITKALFHYDILAGKGANNFKKARTNSAGIAKNLKEANKQLAGFDEMNVLQDTSSANGGGAGGGLGDWEMPDLGSLEQQMTNLISNLKNKWFDFGEEMRKSLYDMPFSVWTKAFGAWDLAVYGVTMAVHGLWTAVTGFFQFFKGIWEIVYGLITGDTEKIKQGFADLFTGIWNGLNGTFEFFKGIAGAALGIVKGLIQTMWLDFGEFINKTIGKTNEFRDKFVGSWTTIRDNIKQKIAQIRDFLTNNFGAIGTTIGNGIAGSIKNVVNPILWWTEKTINGFIISINGAIGTINKLPGVNIKKLTTVSVPRLAKGGIINQPSRGVPVGSAIAGESGAEGVIPLTDSQQMALLGEAIGKYITVNANITNTMNGRVISRELQKIQNENDFAFNK